MFPRFFHFRRGITLLTLASVLAWVISPTPSFAQTIISSNDSIDLPQVFEAAPTEIIVKYKDGPDILVVDARPDMPIETIVSDLNNDPAIEHAEPNYARNI